MDNKGVMTKHEERLQIIEEHILERLIIEEEINILINAEVREEIEEQKYHI